MLTVCHFMIHFCFVSYFQKIYMSRYLNFPVFLNHFLAEHKNLAEHMPSLNLAKLKYSKSYKIILSLITNLTITA